MTTIIKDGQQMDLRDFPALFLNSTGVRFEDEGWSQVFPVPQGQLSDPVLRRWEEGTPVLTNKGHWEQTWVEVDIYSDYTDPEGAVRTKAEQELAATVAAQDAETARLASIEQTRIQTLWQAAHDLEFASISGSAIGLITMGVMSSKPKAVAVYAWVKSIWTLYYIRKAGTSTDCDYSSVGPCPYSVPELIAELEV